MTCWPDGARWDGVKVFAQNVDGLHELAGSRHLLRLTGQSGGSAARQDAARLGGVGGSAPDAAGAPAALPRCGGHARPDVVWFGEALDPEDPEPPPHATACDVFLAIGTSSIVYPAAGLIARASARGAYIIGSTRNRRRPRRMSIWPWRSARGSGASCAARVSTTHDLMTTRRSRPALPLALAASAFLVSCTISNVPRFLSDLPANAPIVALANVRVIDGTGRPGTGRSDNRDRCPG